MYKLQNLDLYASNLLSVNRSLPELRTPECVRKKYPPRLPKASVISIFHNEPWSSLVRTVWSVVNRTPKELLQEIILIDDNSTESELRKPLEDYLDTIPATVRLIRTEKREGLIRARLIGAKLATGSVMVFIDAHSECGDGWLEPLVARIASDRSVVAVPMLHWISSWNMKFESAEVKINPFDWQLIFNW